MDKENLVYMYNGILFNLTKGGRSAVCNSMNGPGEHCVCAQSCPTLGDPMDCVAHQAPQWVSLGENPEASCHLLLQRIFPPWILNSHLSVTCTDGFFTTRAPGKPRQHNARRKKSATERQNRMPSLICRI